MALREDARIAPQHMLASCMNRKGLLMHLGINRRGMLVMHGSPKAP